MNVEKEAENNEGMLLRKIIGSDPIILFVGPLGDDGYYEIGSRMFGIYEGEEVEEGYYFCKVSKISEVGGYTVVDINYIYRYDPRNREEYVKNVFMDAGATKDVINIMIQFASEWKNITTIENSDIHGERGAHFSSDDKMIITMLDGSTAKILKIDGTLIATLRHGVHYIV